MDNRDTKLQVMRNVDWSMVQVLTKKWKNAKADAEAAGDSVARKVAEDKETVFDSLQVRTILEMNLRRKPKVALKPALCR